MKKISKENGYELINMINNYYESQLSKKSPQ